MLGFSDGLGPPPLALVQGGSLRTWSYRDAAVARVQVLLTSDGLPLDADLELWHGPTNAPCKVGHPILDKPLHCPWHTRRQRHTWCTPPPRRVPCHRRAPSHINAQPQARNRRAPSQVRVYAEDARLRPFRATIETPRGPNSLGVRNLGPMEYASPEQTPSTARAPRLPLPRHLSLCVCRYPFSACVAAAASAPPSSDCICSAVSVQGAGGVRTFPVLARVESVQAACSEGGREEKGATELVESVQPRGGRGEAGGARRPELAPRPVPPPPFSSPAGLPRH